jgi:arginyl-tRNA synthetase
MADVEELLRQRLAPAFEAVAGEPASPALRRSQHADFQADGALALARKIGGSPRDVAQQVLTAADLADMVAKAEIAGPGFINLTLSDDWLGRLTADLSKDERLGSAAADQPLTITIDYSAPNAAKEMHVGHLRSTIIGDAAVRVLDWLGHRVLRENHVGDWGTPFGMLIEHLVDVGEAEAAQELAVGDLTAFYQAARRKFDTDDAFKDRSRQRVVSLQQGDPATRRMWEILITESERYFMSVYARLGVRLTGDDFFGESFYNDMLQSVVDELGDLGLLREDDGAQCVFPAGFKNRLPLIVRKSDGGFGYAATDLATIRYRIKVLEATRMIYIVGLPQRQHFEMIFEAAREAGWLVPPVTAEHEGFGSVLGADGKLLRTRAGGTVKLIDLLDGAIERASAVVAEKNPDLDEATRASVAEAVGIGAVKYADLSTQRAKDYVFDYDRMLAFEGNTAPYLQYAHARICSIFARAGLDPAGSWPAEASVPLILAEPGERALAIALLGFETAVSAALDTFSPHKLCTYLFELAGAFTGFYETCPVLRAENPEVRASRLALCALVAAVLRQGLGLLGIEAPTRM